MKLTDVKMNSMVNGKTIPDFYYSGEYAVIYYKTTHFRGFKSDDITTQDMLVGGSTHGQDIKVTIEDPYTSDYYSIKWALEAFFRELVE